MDLEKAKEANERAKAAFQKKDFPTAIKGYTEAISFNPSDHLYFSNRSACYASLQQYEDALEDAKKCLELNPGFVRGYSRKGLAEFYLKKYEDAANTYREGLKIDPNNQQLKDGLEEAEKGLKGPEDGMFGNQKEILSKLLSDPQTKEYFKDQDFINKLQLCQTNPQMLFTLMQSDPRFQKVFQVMTGISMDDLMKGAQGAPGAPGAAPEGMGAAPGGMGAEMPHTHQSPPTQAPPQPKPKPEKTFASEEEKAEYMKKQSAEEEKLKGNEEYKKKNMEQAIEHYDKAIELFEKEPIYYFNKASVYLEMKKYDECLEQCDKGIEIAGNLMPKPFDKIAKGYTRKGNCYTQMNELAKAIEMYDKALLEVHDLNIKQQKNKVESMLRKQEEEKMIDPAKSEEFRESGNKFFRDGNFAAAIHDYDEAIKRNPKNPVLYLNRGLSVMKILDYSKALEDMEKAIELDPKYTKAYAKKGNVHYFMKEYHKAMEAYNKGLELDPTNQECMDGKSKTQSAIYSSGPDEERAKRAMADPEIQALLRDPRIIQVLKEAKENPSAAMGAMSDPFISQGINKLIAAGILGVK